MDNTMPEFGLDQNVKGIQNAMVAQCAWFLDGHIQALRNHWQRKIEEAEKRCDVSVMLIKGKLLGLQAELNSVKIERDELKQSVARLSKETYAQNGAKTCSHMVGGHCEFPTTDNQRELLDRLHEAENCLADIYALSLGDNHEHSCSNVRERIIAYRNKTNNQKEEKR